MKSSKAFIDALGLKYPLIQAPMAGVSTPLLAAKVADHGCLGSLPFGASLTSPQKVFDDINKFLSLSNNNKTVNVNFFSHDINNNLTNAQTNNWHQLYNGQTRHISLSNGGPSFKELEQSKSQFDGFMDQLCTIKPKVVSFHFGVPSAATITRFQNQGIMVFAAATSLKEVEYLLSLKVDGIVLQGYEAGGHRGNFLDSNAFDENLSTWSLFQKVKTLLNPPCYVIASGGIVSGAEINRYLESGASGCQLGTVFVSTEESLQTNFIQENRHYQTIMTDLVSGRNARCLRTPFIESLISRQIKDKITDLPPYQYSYSGYKKWKSEQGTEDVGFYLVGQNYNLYKQASTTEEVMRDLTKDIHIQ